MWTAHASETDWLAGAAGFEPLHLEIRSAELHPASTGSKHRSGAPLIRDAQVRVPPPRLRVLANSDSNMQRLRPRHPTGADMTPSTPRELLHLVGRLEPRHHQWATRCH